MTIHRVNGRIPHNLAPERFSKNGQLPSAPYFYQVAKGLNHSASFQKKAVFAKSVDMRSPATNTTPGDVNSWRFYFRSGYGGNGRLVVMLGLAPAAGASVSPNPAPVSPSVRVGVTPSGGGESWSDEAFYPAVNQASAVVNPDEIFHTSVYASISADTAYECRIQLRDHARIVYAMAFEEPSPAANDANTGLCDPSAFTVTAPIEDAAIQKVLEAGTDQWKRNGAHLLSWAEKTNTFLGTASGTMNNVLDSTTTVSSTTAGWNLDLAYKDRLTETVPVAFAFHGKMSGGGGSDIGAVQISDGTNVVGTTMTSTTAAWYVATGNLPAALAKFDIQVQLVSGGSSTLINAAALYVYKA